MTENVVCAPFSHKVVTFLDLPVEEVWREKSLNLRSFWKAFFSPLCFLDVAGVQQMAYGGPDLSRRICWRPQWKVSPSSWDVTEFISELHIPFKVLHNIIQVFVWAFISYSHSGRIWSVWTPCCTQTYPLW